MLDDVLSTCQSMMDQGSVRHAGTQAGSKTYAEVVSVEGIVQGEPSCCLATGPQCSVPNSTVSTELILSNCHI